MQVEFLITNTKPRTSLGYGVISTTNLIMHIRHVGIFMTNLPIGRAASLETNFLYK